MDPHLATFSSISELKESQVHYNHYNVFHILERKRLLHIKSIEVGAANGDQDKKSAEASNAPKGDELDTSTMAYKMYHSLDLPPIPPRYHDLNLPSHWLIDIAHNQKKRRVHRKSHGLIPFKELARMIADNHKSVDYETRAWCQDVAYKIMSHNKAMQQEFTKAHKKVKKAAAEAAKDKDNKASAREVTQDISPRPALASFMNGSVPGLPAEQRHANTGLQDQHTLQAYRMALESERMRRFDLAHSMMSDRERMAASAFSPFSDRMHGFNMMYANGSHPMSAPNSHRQLGSAWDRQDMPMSLPFERSPHGVTSRVASRNFPIQSQLPYPSEASAAAFRDIGPGQQTAAKTDEDVEMKTENGDETKSPSLRFDEILYKVVNDPKTNDIVGWLPCGTIFNISDKKEFTKQLIPMFEGITGTSNNEKFKCFRASLKKYGFQKVNSETLNGAYKKEGFVKFRDNTMQGNRLYNHSAASASRGNDSSPLRRLEMLSTSGQQAQVMYPYPRYPHRASLPDMLPDRAGFEQSRRMSMNDDVMFGYYQGLATAAAASGSAPYDFMMGGRRQNMPGSMPSNFPSSHAQMANEVRNNRKDSGAKDDGGKK